MIYSDKRMTCSEAGCGANFNFPASEQDFFARLREKDSNIQDPKRCPKCRKNRKNKHYTKLDQVAYQNPEPIKSFSRPFSMNHYQPSSSTNSDSRYEQRRTNVINQKPSEQAIIAELKAENMQLKNEIEELCAQLNIKYPAKATAR